MPNAAASNQVSRLPVLFIETLSLTFTIVVDRHAEGITECTITPASLYEEKSLMKNALRLLVGWLGVMVSSSAAQLPQPSPPTFRIGVDAVQLDVSVLDAHRRPVRGLTAADFTIVEGGKSRRIL